MSNFLDKLFSLEGQTIVVIGGTGVLGGQLCEGIAQAGATVVVAGRSVERGEERVAAIKNLGGKGTFAPVDATDRASVQTLLETVCKQHGRVHALVNCAGVAWTHETGGAALRKFQGIAASENAFLRVGDLCALRRLRQIHAQHRERSVRWSWGVAALRP